MGDARRLINSNARRKCIAIASAGLAILGLHWVWRVAHEPPPGRDHREAVALGRAFLARGRPDLALRAVSDIRDEGPGAGEAMTVAGMAMLKFGQVQSARLALERALRLQPDQPDAARALAGLNMQIGNSAGATQALEIAARLQPGDRQIWLSIGRVHHDLGDSKNAVRGFLRAAQLKPDDHEALLGLIRELLDLSQLDLARDWLSKALHAHTDDPAFWGLKARLAFDSGQFAEAITAADRALARDPDEPYALEARGRARLARTEYAQAVPDLERAIAASPNELEKYSYLIESETRLGRGDRVAAAIQRRLGAQQRVQLMGELLRKMELSPDDPVLRWRFGRAAMEGGMSLLARRSFEAALSLDPGYQAARDSLEELRAIESGAPGRAATPAAPGEAAKTSP